MTYILLAVVFSVAVSVLLKLARRANVDIVQAVATNYVVAASLCVWLLHATPQAAIDAKATYAPLAILGILLPAIFLMLARSVRSAGIVRTDVAQRLSLFLSLVAAFAFLGDTLTGIKSLGIVLALLAVFCVLWRKERGGMERGGWLAPLSVFVGFGAIDICFKLIAQAGAPFASALLASFLIAMVLCWVTVLVRAAMRQAPVTARSMGFGVLLGAANFANILFYVRGHQALPKDPSLVFASMNVGVVVLGAFVGAFGFKERLAAVNWFGVVLAIGAIGVMTIA
ncbi:drug/metabolite transporter (DMT)-like permease [Luteibacter jiangsuensis]|uniref:Drug/metabolite transporter (DMT)-like permease n=1 Tax=Luteibacter jiangsuensis TaxID=637577 RepID=A0ABT9SWI2_9GAMM|nr:EamA/RhaT family transporter [Luteibacter jiangsuensis]MDQ0009364.1 drug/metabolite transporter (DMT)-like permease [Luteibacter jiangsuensis]